MPAVVWLCQSSRQSPGMPEVIDPADAGGEVAGPALNENELVARPVPPVQISKPADTSFRYQEDWR